MGGIGIFRAKGRNFSWNELSGVCHPQAQRYPKPELITELTRLEKTFEVIKSKTNSTPILC